MTYCDYCLGVLLDFAPPMDMNVRALSTQLQLNSFEKKKKETFYQKHNSTGRLRKHTNAFVLSPLKLQHFT